MNSRDFLKERIDQNRGEFEVYDFDVEKGHKALLHTLSPRPIFMLYGKAVKIAAIFLVLLSSAFFFFKMSDAMHNRGQYPQEISEELIQLDIFYTTRIEDKKERLKQKYQGDELYAQDMSMLERAFNDLKDESKEVGHSEEVLSAMIENYKIRLEILQRMLDETKMQSDESNMGSNL